MAARRRGRVGGRHPVGEPLPDHRHQRHPHAGHGGASPVPAPAAAPTAAADGLRDLDARVRAGHRVLPRSPPGRHPQPCPSAPAAGLGRGRLPHVAERQAPGASPAAALDPRPRPQPGAQPPDPLQHDEPGARPRREPGHPHVRQRPTSGAARHQVRLPADVRAARCALSSGCRGPARPRRPCRGRPADASGAAGHARGHRQAERRRLGRGQRSRPPRGPARAGLRGGTARRHRPTAGPGARGRGADRRGLPGVVRRGRRDHRGAHRRRPADQPERADAGDPGRLGRAVVHPRPDARRPHGPAVPRLRVPGRPGVLPADHGAGDGRRPSTSRASARSAGSPWTSWSSRSTGSGRLTRSS